MKNILILSIVLLVSNISYSQKKVVEDSISVSGNCQMCKKRIESALINRDGVKYAEWNVKTKKLFIAYREDKISTQEVHKAIAAAGHDTDLVKSEDLVYSELPFCCLYRDHDPHGPNGEEQHENK
ncbi:heavy-metal-associated domain-containing protein [Fulvivirga lutea]|uniref:Heavy-metal-associated domain-containing protein n=1 Tax=Fulvivirga lutea TaxID=2810512 RepID=A0A975A1C8_9BACT|nr:heavy metal-associated domain-containing protein [Fulvivirga lutea]QSE97392.1 heavy-metal-associated domain-containing protein [Fulvivirga lutea]